MNLAGNLPAISRALQALKDWRFYLTAVSFVAMGFWLFSRINGINPAILGDEYIYSVNARKVAPWDAQVAGDFSNYLFNLVYKSTELCGPNFYSCAKVLNIFFFLGFCAVLLIIAMRHIGFWAAYGFSMALTVSPLSVYTSMFLPESMYFFFISLVFASTLHALQRLTPDRTMVLGALLGITSLVKPHAWLSAIPLALVLGIVALTQESRKFRIAFKHVSLLAASAIVTRLVFGFLIAGPKVFDFFGQYAGGQTLNEIAEGSQGDPEAGTAFSGPIQGVVELFGGQLAIHTITVFAIMGVSVVALLSKLLSTVRLNKSDDVAKMALLVLVWLIVLVIEIVAFTGWVTGSGDDHTTRVLIRYYDFLFAIVPLAGLVVFVHYKELSSPALMRWLMAGAAIYLMTIAFTGFFGGLTIQIADAPSLAGLVVNLEVFNTAALAGFVALAVYATFPTFTKWTYLLVIPVMFIGTGWQAMGQYELARGDQSSADRAGLYIQGNFSDSEIAQMLVVASSRFDATNIGFWADMANLEYQLYQSGSSINAAELGTDMSLVVSNGDLTIYGDAELVYEGAGFRIYELATGNQTE